MPNQPVIDIANIIVQMDGSKINTNKITTIKFGIDAMTSSIRCIIVSTRPPKNPEIAPYTTSIKISNIAATTPINNEI
ncbi:Uncharacterised protein [Staphylococcus aureus]|nr:Uncharacterised protein [Staphylococcus aureus]